MELSGTRGAEIAMALLAIAIGAAFLAVGWDLKPGVLEPIGPGTVPNATAWITIALALAMLVRTLLGRGGAAREHVAAERWRDVAMLTAFTAAYVVVLGLGLLRYNVTTTVYLLACVLWLAGNRRAALPVALVVALVLGFGLDYLFRTVFVTDLP